MQPIELIIGLALWMGLLSRQAGGGYLIEKIGHTFKWVPEALIGITYAYYVYHNIDPVFNDLAPWSIYVFTALASGWSYIWWQTGHGVFFTLGDRGNYDYNRTNTLSFVIDRFFERGTYTHGYAGMSLKGFLITLLPAILTLSWLCALSGLLMAVSYAIGHAVDNKGRSHPTVWGEILSGITMGACLGGAWLI